MTDIALRVILSSRTIGFDTNISCPWHGSVVRPLSHDWSLISHTNKNQPILVLRFTTYSPNEDMLIIYLPTCWTYLTAVTCCHVTSQLGPIRYPQKMTCGGWVSPFCKAKSDFWAPRPLQNEEPATNVARLYKIGVPNPLFLVHFCDFQNHWPQQSGDI